MPKYSHIYYAIFCISKYSHWLIILIVVDEILKNMFCMTIQGLDVVIQVTFYCVHARAYQYCRKKIISDVFTSSGINLHCFTTFKAKLLF